MVSFHIYHYCAIDESVPGVKTSIDGIAKLTGRIQDMEDYRSLKAAIVKDTTACADKLVILSLNYHGKTGDSE